MKEWTDEATLDSVSVFAEQIRQELERLNCSPKASRQIRVSVDELLTNIASYAYAPGTGKVTVRMWYDEISGMVSLSFIDSGTAYNPLEHEDPDITMAIADRPIGGLGILMVKKKTDGIEYRRENGQNILTIHKRIREE